MRLLICLIAALVAGNISLRSASPQEKPAGVTSGSENPSYILGPGDILTVWALGADEISNKPYTVLPDGYLDLPLVGRVLAGGKSVEDLKQDLRRSLSEYFHDPKVSVTVTDFRSQPVSVLGSVNEPGVHQ